MPLERFTACSSNCNHRAHTSEALCRGFNIGWAPGLTHKHWIRVGRLGRDKHPSLFFIIAKEKKIILKPAVNYKNILCL
jgi:hypothetical protein